MEFLVWTQKNCWILIRQMLPLYVYVLWHENEMEQFHSRVEYDSKIELFVL